MNYSVLFILGLCISAINVTFSSQDVSSDCNDENLTKKLSDPSYHECIQEHINVTSMLHDIREAFNYKNIGDFVDKHCPKWKSFLKCITNYNKDILQCASEETAEVVRSNMNAMNAAVGYICDNPTSILSEFFSGGGVHCIMQKEDSLQECLVDENNDLIVNARQLADIGFPAIRSVPKFYDFMECNVYHNASSCIQRVLDECESKLAKQFFNHLLIVMLQETPCWDALRAMEESTWEHMVLLTLLPKMVPTRARTCPSGGTGFEMAKNEVVNAVSCWNENIDTEAFVKEVQVQTTDMKDITKGIDFMKLVKNYCQKLEKAEICVINFLDAFVPCANDTEKVVITSTRSMIQTALSFVCHRNGERILLFLKEDGTECYSEKLNELKECIENSTSLNMSAIGNEIQADFLSKLFPQSYNAEECRLLRSTENCLRQTLRQCEERTPANLLSSLLNSMIKETPCDTSSKAAMSSSSFWFLLATVLAPTLIISKLRLF